MKRRVRALLACALFVMASPSRAVSDNSGDAGSSPEALAEGLREVRKRYGEDTVRLQTLLFANALKTNPVLAVEVGVDGFGDFNGRKYLALHVETGMIFNTRRDDQGGRLRAVWSKIVAPSLVSLKTCRLPAEGVKIAVAYSHRPYGDEDELRETIEDTGREERAILHISIRDILSLLAGDLTEQGLLDRSRLSVNGLERQLSLEDPPSDSEPLTGGSPAP